MEILPQQFNRLYKRYSIESLPLYYYNYEESKRWFAKKYLLRYGTLDSLDRNFLEKNIKIYTDLWNLKKNQYFPLLLIEMPDLFYNLEGSFFPF